MSESFAELFEQSIKDKIMQPGKVIDAEVVKADNDFVIVNAGLKSEAEIPASQFKDDQGNLAVKPGDVVQVALESLEDGFGQTRLSREKAQRLRAWEELESIHAEDGLVSGRITGRVKGGFTVTVKDIRAFLPGSQVDVRPVKDPESLENEIFDFKLIKLDRVRNNIVVSRRAVVENEMSAEREELLSNLEEGQIITGVVKNITDYGAFVNLGGLDGLLHITDLAWKRVKHPSEVLELGQEIQARVLKFDRDKNRVSLGLKQLTEDPWQDLSRRYPEGARIFGKVTNITDYGAFVELEDGVEGLVHSSEMDWTNKNVHPSRVCHIGDEVEVMVLDVDNERRRISLGMKQCQPNPWEEFAVSHNKGDQITGNIKSITDFGVFVGLDGGIDGLIHLSDLSWDMTSEEAVRQYKKGDEVTAVVLAVDAERERISLGLKQASGDPFTQYVSEHPKGVKVTAVAKEVDRRGVVAELGEGIDAYMRASEAARDPVDDVTKIINSGDSFEAKITSIDRKARKIMLSIRALELDLEDEALEEYSRQSVSSTTLGDKLKEQLMGAGSSEADS